MPKVSTKNIRSLKISCDEAVEFNVEFVGEIVGVKAIEGIEEVYFHNDTGPLALNYVWLVTPYRIINPDCQESCCKMEEERKESYLQGFREGRSMGRGEVANEWSVKLSRALERIAKWLEANTMTLGRRKELKDRGIRFIRRSYDPEKVDQAFQHRTDLRELRDKHFPRDVPF